MASNRKDSRHNRMLRTVVRALPLPMSMIVILVLPKLASVEVTMLFKS